MLEYSRRKLVTYSTNVDQQGIARCSGVCLVLGEAHGLKAVSADNFQITSNQIHDTRTFLPLRTPLTADAFVSGSCEVYANRAGQMHQRRILVFHTYVHDDARNSCHEEHAYSLPLKWLKIQCCIVFLRRLAHANADVCWQSSLELMGSFYQQPKRCVTFLLPKSQAALW